MMKFSISALVALFLSNIPSLYYQLYIIFPWFDTVQHFLGGFFVAMLVWAYFRKKLPDNKIHNLIIVTGVTVLVGVLWEFAEFIANQTLVEPMYRYFGIRGYFMGDLVDTIADLLMDISGAIIFFVLYLLGQRNSKKSEFSEKAF